MFTDTLSRALHPRIRHTRTPPPPSLVTVNLLPSLSIGWGIIDATVSKFSTLPVSTHLTYRAIIFTGFLILVSQQTIHDGLQVSQTSVLSAQLEAVLYIQSNAFLLVTGLQ